MQILGGAAHLAHVAGHLHAAHDGAGKQALPDGPGTPPPALGAVRGVAAPKIVPFHHAFEPAPLGDANGIHKIALRENIRADDVARLDRQGEITEFADAFGRGGAIFFEMAQQPLGHAMFLLVVKAQLHRVVAVGRLRFGLENTIGAGQDDGHGHDDALGVIDAGLAQLFS